MKTESTPSVLSIRQKKIDLAITAWGNLSICDMTYFSQIFGFWPVLVGLLAIFQNRIKFLEMEKMRRQKCYGKKYPIILQLSKKRILKLPLFFCQFFKKINFFENSQKIHKIWTIFNFRLMWWFFACPENTCPKIFCFIGSNSLFYIGVHVVKAPKKVNDFNPFKLHKM